MSINSRLGRLEQWTPAPEQWRYAVSDWLEERRLGLSVDERERKHLAKSPQHADAIRAQFARVRARRAAAQDTLAIMADESRQVNR